MQSNISAHTNKVNTQTTGFSAEVPNFEKACLQQIKVKGEKKCSFYDY